MSKQTDISKLIQQYLEGKLDAKAMHQLEREAINDPFLADALEGYTGAKPDQQANLSAINTRLQSRTETKVKRLIPWKLISVAASVIIVLTIGGLWLYNDEQTAVKEVRVALNDKTEVVTADTVHVQKSPLPAEDAAIIAAPPVARQRDAVPEKTSSIAKASANAVIVADGQMALTSAAEVKRDSIALEDRIVQGYFAAPAAKAEQMAAAKPAESKLPGRISGIKAESADKPGDTHIIQGKVIDGTGPLPGAKVRVLGTDIMALTDAAGRFRLPVDSYKVELDVDFIGYLNKQVEVNNKDSMLIAMQPDNQALSEVVVVGFGTKRKANEKARPVDGWKAYKKYLEENAISPDGKKGTVKLSFTVNTDNTLTAFKIINSVNSQTDDMAIELVKKGSEWLHNANGKPEVITLSIKFKR